MRRCRHPFLYFSERERKQLCSDIFSLFLGVRKELKRNYSAVNRLRWHRWFPMPRRWTMVQRSFVQYGQRKRLSNIPIHVQDRSRQRLVSQCGRGTQTEVALKQRSRERVCVLRWTDLTTCDVNTSPEVVIFQMHAKEMIHSLDDHLKIHIRSSG